MAPDLLRPREASEGIWWFHLPAFEAWQAVSGEWAVAVGMGGIVRLGLDAARAKAALELAGIALDPADWPRLRQIAEGAAEVLNG